MTCTTLRSDGCRKYLASFWTQPRKWLLSQWRLYGRLKVLIFYRLPSSSTAPSSCLRPGSCGLSCHPVKSSTTCRAISKTLRRISNLIKEYFRPPNFPLFVSARHLRTQLPCHIIVTLARDIHAAFMFVMPHKCYLLLTSYVTCNVTLAWTMASFTFNIRLASWQHLSNITPT